jgi:hypothetical protein
MQFFSGRLSQLTDEQENFFSKTECELFPGVILERRAVLGCGLAALAAVFCSDSQRAFGQQLPDSQPPGQDAETIELETLIAKMRPEARRLIATEKPDEEKYIELAIKELSRVTKLETNRFMPGHEGWEMDFQAYVPPVLLYQIRMSPNSIIKIHDHRHHNGALSLREGTARVRSFDIYTNEENSKWDVAAGVVPALEEEFLIQEKNELTLKQGQAAGLTRTRENIHQIEAGPEGCLLYDLFTNFKSNAQSFEIQWDGNYSDRSNRLCKVTWIAPDHSHE